MIHAAKCIKLSYVLYCILVIRYNLNFVCFITCFSCNWASLQLHIEVQVDIHNELSFQMFGISLVQPGIIDKLYPITLSTISCSNACLQLLSKSFAWLLDSI